MAAEVTKKVRMSRADARRLRRLARQRGTGEREVLREGMNLVEGMEQRRKAIEGLIAMIDGPEPPKTYFRMR